MLKKRTQKVLVEEMINSDLEAIAENVVTQCKTQWEQRKNREDVSPKEPLKKGINFMRGVPNTWCTLVNTETTPCPKCKKPGILCTSLHMKYAHRIEITSVYKIWKNEICPITDSERKISREGIKKRLETIIQRRIEIFEEVKAKILLPEPWHVQKEEFNMA